MSEEWQPIETAPKDGTTILAVRDENPRCGYSLISFDEEFGWCGLNADHEKRVALHQPTHWIPIPPRP